ncbi:MAG: DNA adenine methylase [Candidatus Poribacteria bacterium]|nr:DNA adenine methylase [Candidatus Poribacteria bacterium]
MAATSQSVQQYEVRNGRNQYHLIPYIGNKSGFSHIFDDLIPDDAGEGKVVDVFGGSGAFAIYCCFRFGSENVVYNDNNPVLTNFVTSVRDNVKGLIREYNRHRAQSSTDYFLKIRTEPLTGGLKGAGRFLYLAKNAFSGKIRFNKKNRFNAPMRKSSQCPALSEERLSDISQRIRHMKITNDEFEKFRDIQHAFLYLDPPYMNNTNGHYNQVPTTESFAEFVRAISPHNRIMISEQNEPAKIGIPKTYKVYHIMLRRSLQYVTQKDSTEIIAINYSTRRRPSNV